MPALRTAFNAALYQCSRLVPRSKDRWAFIGWHIGAGMETFADNTKYLFLHVSEHEPGIRAVWLAKDRKLAALLRSRGYASYCQYGLRGIWEALRAGTTVIDAYLQGENYRLSGGSRLVQLTHGRGMKKGGYGHAQLRPQDYIFCASPFVERLLGGAFKGGAQVFHTGYPRNDALFAAVQGGDISTDAAAQRALDRSAEAGMKRILYAPTFRRGEKVFGIESKFDLDRVNAWLAGAGAHLYINLHPKYRNQARAGGFSHIFFIGDSDIYPLLSRFDALITDYSSIAYDFVLLDRPMVFFPYDLERYGAEEGLAFPYDDYTPGPVARDLDSLMAAVSGALREDSYKAERARVRGIYHTHADGNSSRRVAAVLKGQG